MGQNCLHVCAPADVITFSYNFSQKYYPESPDAAIKVQRMIFEFRPSYVSSAEDTETWLATYWPSLS